MFRSPDGSIFDITFRSSHTSSKGFGSWKSQGDIFGSSVGARPRIKEFEQFLSSTDLRSKTIGGRISVLWNLLLVSFGFHCMKLTARPITSISNPTLAVGTLTSPQQGFQVTEARWERLGLSYLNYSLLILPRWSLLVRKHFFVSSKKRRSFSTQQLYEVPTHLVVHYHFI